MPASYKSAHRLSTTHHAVSLTAASDTLDQTQETAQTEGKAAHAFHCRHKGRLPVRIAV